MHATITGEGCWAVAARGTGFSAARVPVIISHTINPCLRRNRGIYTLRLTPRLSLGSRFPPGGGPHFLCQWCGAFGMSREPGKAGSAHKGWDREEGCTQTLEEGDGKGAWWVGARAGGQLGS